jgi:N-methylhydantoinase B
MENHPATKFDGAQLAVLHHRFEGIARKMSNTLLRTGRSGVLNRAKDFSCCIVTRDCELLSAAESLPIHVLSGPDLMARSMCEFHPELNQGDAFLHNSPYHGCSHPADHTILMPVIDRTGEHHFTVIAKAHQADIGNSIPTTYVGTARDVYEEGALIFPAVKVQSNYELIDDIVRMCQMRIRVPEQWYGDFLAMIGAARIGERELLLLGEEIGWDDLHAFAAQWFDYSEHRMIVSLKALPSGSHSAISIHDPLPGTPEVGVVVKAKVLVDSEEAKICVDLTENQDSMACGLNMSEACARTAALIGVFNSIDHTIPKNAGAFRRVNIILREGCVVGIPNHPTSCSVSTTNVADRISAAVQRALSNLSDTVGLAEVGCVLPPSTSVISGIDPRNHKPFINQLFLGATGGAGSPTQDCWLTMLHVGNGGMCYIDSVELDELYQPIHVVDRHLIQDSEGPGEFRGASALYVEFSPVDCRIEVGYVSDGSINVPLGARGGGSARGAEQYRRKRDGELEPLSQCAQIWIEEGESLVCVTCGGGGYGEPKKRDPSRVYHDLAEGIISQKRAEDIYGLEPLHLDDLGVTP